MILNRIICNNNNNIINTIIARSFVTMRRSD